MVERSAPAHRRDALPGLLLVACGGAVATLFINIHSGLKPVVGLLASIDWATLLSFAAVFVLVGGLERSGALDALATQLAQQVGQSPLPASMWLLLMSAALSALLPNIFLVAAWTPLLLEGCSRSGLRAAGGISLPAALPLFEALMLGVLIGGSVPEIGPPNLGAAGVERQQGSRLGLRTQLSYGLPTVGLQLAMRVRIVAPVMRRPRMQGLPPITPDRDGYGTTSWALGCRFLTAL